jgi:hypothetical protein
MQKSKQPPARGVAKVAERAAGKSAPGRQRSDGGPQPNNQKTDRKKGARSSLPSNIPVKPQGARSKASLREGSSSEEADHDAAAARRVC